MGDADGDLRCGDGVCTLGYAERFELQQRNDDGSGYGCLHGNADGSWGHGWDGGEPIERFERGDGTVQCDSAGGSVECGLHGDCLGGDHFADGDADGVGGRSDQELRAAADGGRTGTDGDEREPEQRLDGRRHGGDDHRHELRQRGNSELRRDSSDQRGGGEQHDDHGDDAGGQRGCGDGDGDNSGGLSGSLTNGFTYEAPGAISFAQVASSDPQTPTATVTVSYPSAQTLGDMNIVVVGWNGTTATVQSVTDSAGNAYKLAIGPTSGTALRQSIYYAPNIAGGSNTVTVTFSQAAAYPDIRILEYRGVTTLDVTAGASGSSTSPSSGSATTSSANELIFGANTVATGNKAAGSGFTARIITSPDGDLAEDMVTTAAGSNAATATLSSAGPWVMQMATFAAVTGPPPTVALSGLSCSSGTLTGAGTDACTVTLTGAAGTGGLAVSLSSSSSAVTVPASVTVPAGASSAGFTATATAVTTSQTATLTASAGGVTRTYALQLTSSGPALTLQSTSVSFGDVTLNTPATQTVTLTSSGTAPLTISAGTVTGTGFSISGISFPVTLNTGQTATLSIEFDPKTTGPATGTVTLTDNTTAGTAAISLSGTGQAASYVVDLTWDAPASSSDPVAGYNIYRAVSGSSSYQLLNSTVNEPTTYADTTVTNGTAYQYDVESVDASGNRSAPSNVFSVTIP